jgi:hypothetical protein
MTQIKVFKGLPSECEGKINKFLEETLPWIEIVKIFPAVSDERYIDEFGNEQIQSITQTIVMYEILGSTSDDYYPRRPEISI